MTEKTKEDQKAIESFKIAADAGDAEAQYRMGCFYEIGRSLEKDSKKSFEYFKLAADQGHAWGQFNLAMLYFYGIFNTNIEEVIDYLKSSAEQGHQLAKKCLNLSKVS